MDAETWKIIVDTSQAVAALAGGLSAVFAGLAITKASIDRKNEHLLKHAKSCLERAYSALCEGSESGQPPNSDRLAWLTAARLIEEYRSCKARIKDALSLQECESHEEHWRHQFYVKLQPLSEGPMDYYRRSSKGAPIQNVSAVIVHSFADWPEGKEDTLAAYKNADQAIEELGLSRKWFVLRQQCGLDD